MFPFISPWAGPALGENDGLDGGRIGQPCVCVSRRNHFFYVLPRILCEKGRENPLVTFVVTGCSVMF